METTSFDKLLLNTVFCCMASDGKIDEKEIAQIKEMNENSELFKSLNFLDEINLLISKINLQGKDFIKYYFDLLDNSTLSEEEEFLLIDLAIKTIHSDGIDEYSEITFFKNIRHRLKLSDDKILKIHPEVEYWLEDDIKTESFIKNLTDKYLDSADLPQFDSIHIDTTEVPKPD